MQHKPPLPHPWRGHLRHYLTCASSGSFPKIWRPITVSLRDMNETTGREPVRKRATDDLRASTIEELSAAVARGQLTLEEFDARSAQAWAARFVDELSALIIDATDTPAALAVSPAAGAIATEDGDINRAGVAQAVERAKHQISGRADGSALSLSIMGGAERKGNWLCPNTHTTITVMGGNLVDLRDAYFQSGEIRINAFALMGGIEIIVPEGVRVICDGIGLMGGFGAEVHKETRIHPGSLPVDAPIVRVGGLAIMGGVSVITKPRT